MFQIRIHGRGGQGVVTAAEMLSIAAFEDGKHAQAFPTFGSERTGAPVTSYCRIDEKPIRIREPIAEPDALIIQDPTLLHQVKVFSGLKKDGYVLINTSHSFEDLGLGELAADFALKHLLAIPASEIAKAQIGRPLPNTALLGGFAAMTGVVTLQAVSRAISQKFSGEIADRNVLAADLAYNSVADGIRKLTRV
ncbi:MAG TPA: 2-oxoacid:acceptor oxidoreductase family protein [Solirubrobacterales bacterium]|jgi:pyruvate ferredoxin oxidoreductase gamma subunit|nr:2-oxoacid:acceptor oxidoreductase family protein [Solirubrobacterales bacterium]